MEKSTSIDIPGVSTTYPYITTEVPIIRIDPNKKPDIKIKTVHGNIYCHSKQTMTWAEAHIGIREIGAGETFTWSVALTEVHYILRGKAEMTYSMRGNWHTEQKKVMLEEGDAYILPVGTHVTWKTPPDTSLRRLCFSIPPPGGSWGKFPAEAVEKLE